VSYIEFAEEKIDSNQISDFTYASRKQPEFMCLRLVQCTNCDLVYAPAPPTSSFLHSAYSDAAYDSGPEAASAALSYAKALTKHIKKYTGRNAAIDIGAGSGPLLPWLLSEGFKPVIGIEPSRAAIDAAPPAALPMLREGMFSPEIVADVKDASLLCSFMTLEHMENPGKFVKQAYEKLEPGGMLAVVVHNRRAALNRLLGLHSPIIDVEHLQLFSPQSLRELLTRTGFESVRLHSISNTYPLRYWLRLTPLPVGLKLWLTKVLDFFGIADIQIPFRVGNMLAVSFKPLVKK
jgi:SAM-dependent methyltransferase